MNDNTLVANSFLCEKNKRPITNRMHKTEIINP